MTPAQKRAFLIVAAVSVLVACLGVLVVVLWQLRTPPSTQGPLNATDARQLVESKNVGLAHLENHEPARSIPIFGDIAARLPDEPLGPRNLAVSHVLALGEDYEHVTAQRLAEARAALELVRKTEGATPQWHWLSARTEMAAGDFAAAIGHLSKIVAADGRNASAWYDLFLARHAADGAESRSEAMAALARAFELRPDNLFLLVEYLRQLEEQATERQTAIHGLSADEQPAARRQAITELGDLGARLRQARQTLAPFHNRLQALTRVDVLQMMDEAIAASDDGDLGLLAERAGQVARVTLGTAAQDRSHLRRHTLEFVLFRFRPEFYEQHGLDEAEPTPAINVSFDVAPDWQLDEPLQDKLADVEAVELADFDLDGRLDLFMLDATGVHVFTRIADTEPWRLLTGSPTAAGMTGLVVADLDLDFDETPDHTSNVQGPRSKVEDSDEATDKPESLSAPPPTTADSYPQDADIAAACASADVDIVAFGPLGVIVLRNRFLPESGMRLLERIEQPLDNPIGVTAATAADLDADGDLDLVIAAENGLSIWSNRGNAAFEDISPRSSLPPGDVKVTALVAVDWDRDVDVDVMVSGEQAGWLENLRHGQTRWHTFEGDFSALSSAFEIEPLDADANGSWDLLAGAADGLHLARTMTPQPGVVRPLDVRDVSDRPAQGVRSFDYDNDGVQDLIAWDDNGPAMYRGLPEGRYRAVDLAEPLQDIRDCGSGDLDGDGDLDLVVATSDGVTIFLNQGGNQNQWLDVALKARQIKGSETSASGRVNAHGLGSLLELKAGTRYQPAVVRGQSTHFGLGQEPAADVVRVVWLNGVPQNIIQPAAKQAVCEQQLLTGSCPYLYSWNGTAFEFVTDLLWASPLGLQAADGVLLPWREWEYIKIPGDKLVAKDGEYPLRFTEELWEAAYFDQVKLIAIDHPADVDIYSNEKVGPAEIAQFKIHTAGEKRRPIAARNHRARDLLPELSDEDNVYAKPFDNKLRQGLVEEHCLELDLGDLNDAKQVTLFLTGWIYPSGTSLNVAISQNPELHQPRPPALFVPDGNGGWREVLPYMGFPGGKTKTIAVDLTGLLTKGDHRVRIATNLELYWDQVFFTVDEPPVELRQIELELRAADLGYRGFSRIVHDRGYGPEHFLYDEVTTVPKWPPMRGRFTRFGDVTELLHERDDRMVAIGAGDEIALRFRVPAGDPPAGWKRDFLLYSVGWDKDANLCTVLGETVEPLPFRAMRSYPPAADDRPPGTLEYQQYVGEYQSRAQSDAFWRALRPPDNRR